MTMTVQLVAVTVVAEMPGDLGSFKNMEPRFHSPGLPV